MKALVYTQPHVLEIQDIPRPSIKDDEVLLHVRAAGVCGSDMHGFHGRSKLRIPPLVLGHEFSGEVVETGKRVTRVRQGDRVAVYPLLTCGRCIYCNSGRTQICPDRKVFGLHFQGALAEYAAAPEECLFTLPPSMTYEEGALVEPLANAVHVVKRCRDVSGRTGVIFGAGSIGLLVWWVARHKGAEKIALVDLNDKRLEMLSGFGASLAINAGRSDVVKTIQDWTGGIGADFTVDAVGLQVCREQAVETTARDGVSVWIGLEQDEFTLSGMSIVNREIEIKGSYAYSMDDFAEAISLLERKLLPVEQFITRVCLDDGQKVFESLASPDCETMKAIFTIS